MSRPLEIARSVALLLAVACGSAVNAAAADLAAVARDAYVFSFPLYESYRIRYLAQCSPFNPHRTLRNAFHHRRTLADAGSRAVTAPNADTLYSSSFLDLSRGPLILHVPEVSDRYYSLAFMDFYTNNFAYVGTRTTGSHAGQYLIAGPGWTGSPPTGTPMIRSPTDAVWLLGRFQVSGKEDLPQVHREQDGLALSPLSGAAAALPRCSEPPGQPDNPFTYFAIVDDALTENPPPARDAAIMARIAAIDVGPGKRFQPSRFDDAARQALHAGVAAAREQIAATNIHGRIVNGWVYPPPGVGNFGTDYLLRAAVALKGLAALSASEATYLHYAGEKLVGNARYRLHFAAGNQPPADAFWSLSAYEIMPDTRRFFAANPIDRYSIGDKTPGLKRNSDGSLDILIQHVSPGPGRESNWLPAPAGPFALSLRAYLPRPALLDGSYAPPPVARQP
jgi:hypothetical protein